MLNLKKTAVAVLAISSSAAFAGPMGPVCSAVPVTMPCESSGWEVGARALYWNIGNGNLSSTVSNGSGSSATGSVGPGFGWGFQINGAMTYGTGKSVSLDWYHIQTNRTRNFGANNFNMPINSGTIQTIVGLGGINEAQISGSATSKPQLDDVNMLFGQHIDFSDVTSANLGWGWKWARVSNNINVQRNGVFLLNDIIGTGPDFAVIDVPYSINNNFKNSFNGFGPEVSLLGEYELIDHLNIYGKGEFSALAGYSRSSLNLNFQEIQSSLTVSNKLLTITPVVGGKLGLNYGWDMSGYGVVAFDVNYDFRQYFNSFRNLDMTTVNPIQANTSFSSQGVTFGVDFKFTNA